MYAGTSGMLTANFEFTCLPVSSGMLYDYHLNQMDRGRWEGWCVICRSGKFKFFCMRDLIVGSVVRSFSCPNTW